MVSQLVEVIWSAVLIEAFGFLWCHCCEGELVCLCVKCYLFAVHRLSLSGSCYGQSFRYIIPLHHYIFLF